MVRRSETTSTFWRGKGQMSGRCSGVIKIATRNLQLIMTCGEVVCLRQISLPTADLP